MSNPSPLPRPGAFSPLPTSQPGTSTNPGPGQPAQSASPAPGFGVGNPITSLSSFLGDWQHMAIRVGIGAAGVGLMILGVIILAGSSKPVQEFAGAVGVGAVTKNPVAAQTAASTIGAAS